ncbi:MAG: DUF2088 domain-containing protein [Deltaproteobacteria bacterium]|nr:DUF2088 domain-containing protein [Deltaproteobacteria bacterium]
MELPQMIRIRQRFEKMVVNDISGEINDQVDKIDLKDKISPGDSVAVACSSRGIANYAEIVRTVVTELKKLGLKPFLFPAMGSHGSATGPGQKRLLENSGLTVEKVGAPIRSDLDVDYIAETPEGIPICIDRIANQADHIVLINRIKQHTEFDYEIESGLMKMMAIGLGKKEGAALYHKWIMVHGYAKVIVSVARQVLKTGKILFGVGVVENGYGETAHIIVADDNALEEKERSALIVAKRLSPRLPFEDVDVLVIDEMGKDISGTGFDTKVVGRILMPLVAEEPKSPRVKRIVVCDLTQKTAGNADGIGIADFTTQKLVDKIDVPTLYVNALTGAEPEHARIPMTLANDRKAIAAAIDSVGMISADKLKMMRIKNTLALQHVDVSLAYLETIRERKLEILSDERSMAFDDGGNLMPF